ARTPVVGGNGLAPAHRLPLRAAARGRRGGGHGGDRRGARGRGRAGRGGGAWGVGRLELDRRGLAAARGVSAGGTARRAAVSRLSPAPARRRRGRRARDGDRGRGVRAGAPRAPESVGAVHGDLRDGWGW